MAKISRLVHLQDFFRDESAALQHTQKFDLGAVIHRPNDAIFGNDHPGTPRLDVAESRIVRRNFDVLAVP